MTSKITITTVTCTLIGNFTARYRQILLLTAHCTSGHIMNKEINFRERESVLSVAERKVSKLRPSMYPHLLNIVVCSIDDKLLLHQ